MDVSDILDFTQEFNWNQFGVKKKEDADVLK
jgi:hypothetical protein